jgi:hypothetical protein
VSVVNVRLRTVEGLLAVIVAFGIADDVSSRTVPTMVPVGVCAWPVIASAKITLINNSRRESTLDDFPIFHLLGVAGDVPEGADS